MAIDVSTETAPSTVEGAASLDDIEDVVGKDSSAVHRQAMLAVRQLLASERLGTPTPRAEFFRRLVPQWALAIAAGWVAYAVNSWPVWAVAWVVIAFALVGNAAQMHEAVHRHLFRSRWANQLIGTVTAGTMFVNFATYRAYHLQHHARTAQDGDPEGKPLSLGRLAYVGAILLGGAYVLCENTFYTVITLLGRAPKWARTARTRRAIRLNALLNAALVAGAVLATTYAPAAAWKLWLIPVGVAALVLPLLLLPEHYGATGEGDILLNTRTTRSNALVRWVFWNQNFHAAHHLAPSVPYDRLRKVDDVLDGAGIGPDWRLSSYARFHLGNLLSRRYARRAVTPGAGAP